MKTIKVLFTWHAAVLQGNQNYAAWLAKNADLDVTLLVPPGWDESTSMVDAFVPVDANYRVCVEPVRNVCKGLRFFYKDIGRVLREVQPDVVVLYEEPYSYAAFHTLFQARHHCPDAKFVFYTWQNLICRYSLLRRFMEKYVFKYSHAAIAGSVDVKDVLRKRGFLHPIHIVPLALQPDDYPLIDRPSIRSFLSITDFTVGYVGRLAREKGIEDLLHALAKINDKPFQLLLIGGGEHADVMLALAERLGLGQRVRHIRYVPNADMYKYYQAMDALVLPSRTTPEWKEQFGRVLIEAMICGVPVIGSSSGEIPNVIGDAGLVFPEQDVTTLAERLSTLMADDNLHKKLSFAGRENVLARYTWEKVAARTADVIRGVWNSR